jgi:hypothetical protein
MIHKTCSFAIIAIMGLLIANKGLFTHSHKLENGTVVTHSHPYDKSNDTEPYKSHHHSNAQFLFYENLDLLFFSVFLIQAFFPLHRKKIKLFNREKRCLRLLSYSCPGRAPPVQLSD